MFGWIVAIWASLFGESEAARKDRDTFERVMLSLPKELTTQPGVISSLPTSISSVPMEFSR